MPKPATIQQPPAQIRLSTNTIWEGKFYSRGEPLPVANVEELTDNLRPLVVTSEPEAEEPNEPRGNFQTNTIYEMTPDGRLGRTLRRQVERQVAQFEAEEALEDWIEEEANAELPPEIAQSLQESHESSVEFAKAQLAADARRSDEASDAAAAAAAPPKMYVKRGGRHYAPVGSARLKAGEAVFIRQPDGAFECIGETSGDCELPYPPIII